jgi:hypothetical protein
MQSADPSKGPCPRLFTSDEYMYQGLNDPGMLIRNWLEMHWLVHGDTGCVGYCSPDRGARWR